MTGVEFTNEMHRRTIAVSPAEGSSRRPSVQSIHYNDVAVDAEKENVGAAPIDVISRDIRWIRNNIRMRKCVRFVKKPPKNEQLPPVQIPGTSSNDDRINTDENVLCMCGYKYTDHGKMKTYTDKWEVDTHTRSYRTDTFGEVAFVGHGENERKYIRVDVKSNMRDITTLMMSIWKLEKPNLLISVTGGAKNFSMRTRLKEVFRRGLMKVARSTGAWIVTGGSNTGVMKHVGEAVRDYGLTSASTTPVVAIGIATWGCVQNQQELVSKDGYGQWPARYRIEKDTRIRETFLDPNHTHFILVDDGTRHRFGGEIKFRAKLEKAVADMKTETMTGKDAVSVPVVLLVLQGGPNTLKTISEALYNKTPVVLVEGSGQVADVVAYAYHNVTVEEFESKDRDGNPQKEKRITFDPSVSAEIMLRLKTLPGIRTEEDAVTNTEIVESAIKNNHNFITVFNLSTSVNNTQDIDVAILKALLKANQDQVFDQLKLALAWNRIDIAKSDIFTDDKTWQPGSLDEIMLSAVYLNRVHFVEMFVDNGVSLKEFLTTKRLLQLYNTAQNNLLNTLLNKMKQKTGSVYKHLSLVEVGILLQYLLGDFYIPMYLKDSEYKSLDPDYIIEGTTSHPENTHNIKRGIFDLTKFAGNMAPANLDTGDVYKQDFENPYQQLFLWSVLMNRQELAKLFWKQGKDPIAAALVAFGLLDAMAKKTDDCELAKKLRINAMEFSDLAVDVLNECYEVDEKKAQDLLVRELDHWGCVTCVLVAVETDNKQFISQTACQSLLNSVWMGKLSTDNGTARLLTCVAFPPLIFPLLKYKDEEEQLSQGQTTVPIEDRDEKEDNFEDADKPPVLTRQLSRMQTSFNLHQERESKPDPDSTVNAPRTSNYSVWRKAYYFYTAPVVIFAHNVISYLTFLGLFSYMLLVQLSKDVSVVEIILMVWVFSIFAEEIRQIVASPSKTIHSKLQSYITDTWNIVDVITILLFVCGTILRFLPYDSTLEAARVVLAINLITFFFRILHIFSVHKELGPKLVMIGRMFMDLLYFVIILMVFVVSYAVAAYCILYPYSKLDGDLILNVLRTAYWNLYGELFLEELERKTPDCSFDSDIYNAGTLPRCPTVVGSYVVPMLMGLYVLFSNILLLNLLIAMFSYTFELTQQQTDSIWKSMRFQTISEYCERPSLPAPFLLFSHMWQLLSFFCRRCPSQHFTRNLGFTYQQLRSFKAKLSYHDKSYTFQKIQDNTDLHWYFQRYFLIYEYYSRPMLPPPFLLISHVIMLIHAMFRRVCSCCTTTSESTLIKKIPNERELIQWENVLADAYWTRKEMREDESVESRVSTMHQRIDMVMAKMDQLQEVETGVSGGQAVAVPTVVAARMPPQLELRLNSIEEQMNMTCQTLSWIVKSLQENNMAAKDSPPKLPDLKKKKDEEKRKIERKKSKERQLLHDRIEFKANKQYMSRRSPYPGSKVERFPVPDEKLPWSESYEDYKPVKHEDSSLYNRPEWADTFDLLPMTPQQRQAKIKFNCFDDINNVQRTSHFGKYEVVDGLPLNPMGRTGIKGRGKLGRWGPNFAGDPIVTRWKKNSAGKIEMLGDKPRFEFVCIKRSDNKMWSIPGGICEPGQPVYDCVKADFSEEALGSLIHDGSIKTDLMAKLDNIFKNGQEIYRGYADDSRNTDNAWLETLVYNYHDKEDLVLRHFPLRAGETVEAAMWATATSTVTLHGGHSYYLQIVAERLGAAY